MDFEVSALILCAIRQHHYLLELKKKKSCQVAFSDGKENSLRNLDRWAYE